MPVSFGLVCLLACCAMRGIHRGLLTALPARHALQLLIQMLPNDPTQARRRRPSEGAWATTLSIKCAVASEAPLVVGSQGSALALAAV